jgi:3-oxoacyl-[acyl-carrier-protein] synthase III
MRFESVSMLGLASVDAPVRVTSRELGERLLPTLERFDMRADVIESLTGIVARRFWEPGVQPSEVAALAGERALAAAGIEPRQVGALLSTSVCKDYIEPSVAALVHSRLQLPAECVNFDLGNACLAFLNGMEVAGAMIERGDVDYALVVDGEGSRFITEATLERLACPDTTAQQFRHNFASLTLGSGAAAAVLTRSQLAPRGHRFLGGVTLADTRHSHLCRGQTDQMHTDATALLVAGIALARRTFERAARELGWKLEDFNEFILHQVSANHTVKLADALCLDGSKIHAIYPEYGNMGPASVPLVLAKSAEAGRLKEGDRVALMGIGSGLNCAMMELVW